MKRLTRSIQLAAALFCATADAQQVCPQDPPPRCRGAECKCHPALKGDPINMMSGRTTRATLDFSVDTGLGAFELWRYFSSSKYSSNPTANMGSAWPSAAKGPYGTPSGQTNPIHSNNLFSFVLTNNTKISVFDGTLGWIEFTNTTLSGAVGGYGFLRRLAYAAALTERLEKTTAGNQDNFRLVLSNGEQYIYRHANNTTSPSVYFLSEMRTASNQPHYSINYADPSPPGVNCGANPNGTPFISTIDIQTGSRLRYVYTSIQSGGVLQCVVSRIDYENGATSRTLVSYSYGTEPGSDSLVAISADRSEKISWGAANTVTQFDGLTATHTNDPSTGKVTGDETTGAQSFSVAYGSWPDTLEASSCSADNGYYAAATTAGLPGGSPSAPPTSLTSGFYSYADYSFMGNHGLALRAKTDSCSSGSCSAGSVLYSYLGATSPGYSCSESNPPAALSVRDKRGSWNYYHYRQSISPTAATNDFYLYETRIGASTELGTGALEGTTYNSPPTYSQTTDVRLGGMEFRASALASTGNTVRNSGFDSVGGVDFRSVDKHFGYTYGINDTMPVARHKHTNYRLQRSCDPSSDDPHGRTLSIQGPCLSSDCSGEPAYPVTEFYYHDASAAGFDSGRLWKVARYPQHVPGNCGAPLTTTYSNYTAEGMPQTVVDEAEVTATHTYEGRRLTSRTISGRTTQYTYGVEGLRAIQHPEGNYEVFCYWPDKGGGGCDFDLDGSQRSARPRWKAKAPSVDGASAEEKVLFEYWGSGDLKKETFLSATGQARRILQYFPDAHGRVTWKGSGAATSGSGSVSEKRNFDGADNLAAIGTSSASVPDFCLDANGLPSPLCAWMTHDRANRLAQVDINPNGALDADSTRTCLDYDGQGNVRRVATGCPGNVSGDCAVNESAGAASTCSVAPVDYDVDDFGNVVRVRTPWSRDGAPTETAYEYDVRGNLLKKQTAQMKEQGIWISYAYDQADRLLSVVQEGGSGSVPLYYLGYDSPLNITGCPTATHTQGRLSYRFDSFGFTWYSYNSEGRVVAEFRQRAGATGACNNSPADYPHTYYEYTDNGNIKSIVYPHGREVTYSYGLGGLRDRVSSVSVTTYLNGTWTALPLIQDIVWEPYGGLRGYKYVTTPGGAPAVNSVEYVQNGSNSSPNSTQACGSQTLEATEPDGTGRPRALWVSAGSQPLGAGPGDLLKQFYTWAGAQLTSEQTCFTALGQISEHRQNYSYDNADRLTSVTGSGMPVRSSGSGAGVHERSYGYDRRGNRTNSSLDKCSRAHTMGSGSAVDLLDVATPDSNDPDCLGRYSGYTYFYDKDGRVTRTGTAYWWWYADFGYTNTQFPLVGLDSVFKSVVITAGAGANYQYYYDAFNRRRLKAYPFDAQDEFFYDTGHQLLASVGSNRLGPATAYTVDDYIWLDGRIIAQVRGSFSSSWVRASDDQPSCDRLGEAGRCGVYHVLTDYLPKPVMTVESRTGFVTSAALYDEFGHVNRVPFITGFSFGHTGAWSSTASLPQGGVTKSRLLHNLLDLPAGSNVTLNGRAGVGGYDKAQARVWSDWVDTGTSSTVTAKLEPGNVTVYSEGEQTEALEYRRFGRVTTWGSDSTWKQTLSPGAGWRDLSYNDSAWAASVDEGAHGVAPWYSGAPFPSGTPARWIWNYTANNDWGAGPSTVYFRKTFVPSGTQLLVTMTADDAFTAYLDGVQIVTGSYWPTPSTAAVTVTPGVSHVLAVQSQNNGGPAGFLADITETATPTSLSIRFPGQLHDPETDLFENWNRHYDPSIGRYLQPEPLLQSPRHVAAMAKGGVSVPAYAYAYNNALHYTDETGLFALKGKCTNWNDAMQEAKKRAGCGSNDQKSCACSQKLQECGSGNCDICKILDNADPAHIVNNLQCKGGKDALGCSHRKGKDFYKVEFDQSLCSPPAPASELATVILHEAAHFCREQTGRAIGDNESDKCSAKAISEACK